MEDEEVTQGLAKSAFSRRNVLKGAGVGAVAVWAAPTVMSLGSVANAASAHPPLSCQDCDPSADPCTNQTACGDPAQGCTCKTHPQGQSCLCTANGFCVDFSACPNGDSDCPTGYSCVSSCCNDAGYGNLCIPNCSNAQAIKRIPKNGSGARTNKA